MNKLLNLARTKVGCGYVWGSMGENLTPKLLQWFKDVLGKEHYVFNDSGAIIDAAKWTGTQVFDCSGLVQWSLQQLGYLKGVEKQNAGAFYENYCTYISLHEPLREGDLVFRKLNNGEIVHIGIFAGGHTTIEAKSTKSGVVVGNVGDFNLFGRLKFDLEERTMDWKEILQHVSSNPQQWEKAINLAVSTASLEGDLGDLEVFKFLPALIEKIYNSK